MSDRAVATRRALSGLEPGDRAVIRELSGDLDDAERRRLLELGFLPGTPVEVVLRSPSSEPTAYRVRGTVIALRDRQAEAIIVSPGAEGD